MQHQGSSSSSASSSDLGAMAQALGSRDKEVKEKKALGIRVCVQEPSCPWGRRLGDVESAVSLTSHRALQDGTLGGRAVSMWVLKPLASSRAASSVSCGCKEKDLLHQATPGFGCSTLQEERSDQLSNPEQRQGDWAWLGWGGRQSQGRVAHLLHDSLDSCLLVLLLIREVVLEGY